MTGFGIKKSKSSSPEGVIPFTTEVKASKFMLFAVTLADPTIVVRAFELNTVVDNQLSSEDDDVVPFKKWFIKNIEFSNFLSYGQNQKIDFGKIL